jgi:16S rRNA (guanine527-N7)-methyltransferase
METFEEGLRKKLNLLSIELKKNQIDKFYNYFELLVKWNKFMNLTAIIEMDEVITKHFVDSLSLIKVVRDIGIKDYSIIDVGTGAGFPGIPLKIVFPDLRITLMDSLNKRINFLNEVIDSLELVKIETIHGRAEDLGRELFHREQYDFCVSRAVANLSTLSEYCMPFVKIGGYFISYKSGKVEEELEVAKRAIFLLGGSPEEVKTFLLPGTDVERSLVKIIKNNGVSKKYSRKAGLPSKEPLK